MTETNREALYQQWIELHLGLVIKVARAFAARPDDQEDLLQDILVNLWSSITRFRGSSKETTWIYRVALQTAMVWQRGERRRQKHQALYMNSIHIEDQASPEECDDRERIEQMYAAIRQLPKVEASIALMHLDGLTYCEIGEVLGISENYVGVKLSRIRKELTERLGPSRQ